MLSVSSVYGPEFVYGGASSRRAGAQQGAESAGIADSGFGLDRPAVILNLHQESDTDVASTYTKDGIQQRGMGYSTLTEAEQEQVRELQARDREVRQHEQSHAAQLGPYARGGPVYHYQIGPDGKAYAIGGSVAVDSGAAATPEATVAKAQILRRAALGVGEASAADAALAAKAGLMSAKAQTQLGQA